MNMGNPFDYFDGIYCINLDHRTDRWDQCVEEFAKLGILHRVVRFSAIKHTDGRVGVIKSNLEIVKMAKDNKLNNVLVFEDDVKFLHDKNPLYVLSKTIEQVKQTDMDWKLFYLGANTHDKLTKISKNIVLIQNSFAVHSMSYHSSIYDKFIKYASGIDCISNHGDILDVWLAQQVQSKHTCIMTNPMLTTQRESFSDIENRFVNYDFIEDRFNKNIK